MYAISAEYKTQKLSFSSHVDTSIFRRVITF